MKKGSAKAVPAGKRTAAEKLQYVKKNWQLYVFFLLPALLLTIIFKYVPMGGVLIAFEDYNVIDGVFGSKWVGLEYFRRFLASPDFMNYLVNTLKLSIYGLLWGLRIQIILALLLNQIRRAGIRKKIQLLIYAPNFISVIVLCGMVRMFLSPVGPLNKLIGSDANWMTMPAAFRTIYIASGIWQTAGWASIMYTAALSNASKDLEEAARLDGCNIGQTFLFIMAPLTRSSMVALGIFTAVFAYKDLMWPLICNKDVMPLSAALAKMQGQYTNNYPQLMAASLLACIPMIVLYLIFQKQFIEGIATSGGKL